MSQKFVWCVMLSSMMLFVGCATNKRVTTTTVNQDTMKFVYVQSDLFGSSQGIIKCELNEAGDLSNCREMGVTFKGEDQ